MPRFSEGTVEQFALCEQNGQKLPVRKITVNSTQKMDKIL